MAYVRFDDRTEKEAVNELQVMDNNEEFPQGGPPPYTEQQPGYAGQPGYPTQPGYPAQQEYPAQPGYTTQPGYPAQAQPHTAQPGYPGHQPFSQQPGYPAHAYPPVLSQQTNTTVVMQQPTQTVILATNPRPQNWLGLSICNCLCCSGPLGLIAIILSCTVDSSYDSGDYEGARRMSEIAKWYNVISMVVATLAIIILFAVVISR